MIEVDIGIVLEGDVMLEKIDEFSVVLFFVNVFEDILLVNSGLCVDFVFLLISIIMEDYDISVEYVIFSLEKFFSIDYLLDIYLNILINIFDVMFLDGLVEILYCLKIWFRNLFGVGLLFLLRVVSDV